MGRTLRPVKHIMKVVSFSALLLAVLAQDPVLAISGGKISLPGQFPYQVLVRPIGDGGLPDLSTACSGALIDRHWVLTAASCVSGNASQFHAVLGAFDLTLDEEDSRVVFSASNKTLHPEYEQATGRNDVALLHLDVGVVLDEFIAPIRLPSKQQAGDSFLLWNGAVSGWGRTKRDTSQFFYSVLRWFDSRVMPNIWCRFLGGAGQVHDDSSICLASFWKKGTCLGDAGSPVAVTELDGKATLVGIASNNVASCDNHRPPAFTRVTSLLDWISSTARIEPRA